MFFQNCLPGSISDLAEEDARPPAEEEDPRRSVPEEAKKKCQKVGERGR